MSGHSHWATIKRKKEVNDQEKGRLFAKLTREIMLAISEGGGVTDPGKNVRLRAAVEKAKEGNMPKDNINRLLARLKERAEAVTEVIYEALSIDPINLIIKTATDNPRRTQTELRIILEKNGGKLVAKGGVMHNYDLRCLFTLEKVLEEEALKLMESLNAVDFEKVGETYYIYVPYTQFSEAWNRASELGFSLTPELVYKPKLVVEVSPEQEDRAHELIDKLEEVDDVTAVYVNL
jgi:YebC/PmpR family DNA-binding regulatory protein